MLLYRVAPAAFVSSVPAAILLEGRALAAWVGCAPPHVLLEASGFIALGGVVAFALLLVEVIGRA